MPRHVSFQLKQTPSGSWVVNVPAAYSPNGKRRRLAFETKRVAIREVDRLKKTASRFGTEAVRLDAALAADAVKARSLLDAENIEASLTEAVKTHIRLKRQQEASILFSDLWKQHLANHETSSDTYLRNLKFVGSKITGELGTALVCDITHRDLRVALEKHFPTPHGFNAAYRSIAPAFKFAVKEGWTKENPFARLDKKKTGQHEIRILTVSQCRNLMNAIGDHREDTSLSEYLRVDASRAGPALALLLFGGVRPMEVTRLEWRDLDMDEQTVKVSNKKAKTDRSRIFTMPAPLKAWLATTPRSNRTGPVCPPNWGRVWQVLRKKAGIEHLRDPCRKTFATAHLAFFKDVNATREIMGHETGEVLFTNYRGLMTKKEATAFWGILPSKKGRSKRLG